MKVLTDIGARVVGSYENEVLAVDFLKQEIEEIQKNAHECQEIQLDVQRDSFVSDMEGYPFVSSYVNIQNVVVRVSSNDSFSPTILINSHFDSVRTSPGI